MNKILLKHQAKKYYIQQHDSSDCGAACLAMVCKFYGKDFSIAKLREILGTDIQGTPINGLHHGAEDLGFDAKKVRITKSAMKDNFTVPAICNVVFESGESHFVVLYRVVNDKVLILDPARGVLYNTIDEFFEIFDGLMLCMYPNANFESGKEKDHGLKSFIALIVPQKRLFIYSIVAALLLTALGIFYSLYNKVLMDDILPYRLTNLLVAYSIGFGLVLIAKILLGTVRSHLLLYLSQRIDLPMMLAYFRHIFNLPINFFATRRVGDVTTRFQDAFVIKEVLTSAVLTIVVDVLMALITGVILIVMSFTLFLVILGITLLSALLIFIYKPIYKKLNKLHMEQESKLNSSVIESLTNIETVKSNAYENQTMDKIESNYVNSLRISFRESFHSNMQGTFSSIISGIGNLVLMTLGTLYVINGKMTLGTVMSFFTISGYFMDPIGRLIGLQLHIQEAAISLKRLSEINDIDEEETDEKVNREIKNVKGNILIKDLTFAYGNRPPTLNNINMEIKQGQKIAIVGESGSGKTTITKLLMKFYKVENDHIFIDGEDINEINAFSLREAIGFVPQKIETFSGSILSNIRIGRDDATEDEVRAVCEETGCNKFLKRLPNGLRTNLDEGGGGLSGGERQRLILARAFIKDPKFIILDEATSHLDYNTEMEIFELLFKKKKNITMLIIAHRLSTVRVCDKIYVMDKGNLVEEGKHEELLKKKGYYYKLWSMQLGYLGNEVPLEELSIDSLKNEDINEDNEDNENNNSNIDNYDIQEGNLNYNNNDDDTQVNYQQESNDFNYYNNDFNYYNNEENNNEEENDQNNYNNEENSQQYMEDIKQDSSDEVEYGFNMGTEQYPVDFGYNHEEEYDERKNDLIEQLEEDDTLTTFEREEKIKELMKIQKKADKKLKRKKNKTHDKKQKKIKNKNKDEIKSQKQAEKLKLAEIRRAKKAEKKTLKNEKRNSKDINSKVKKLTGDTLKEIKKANENILLKSNSALEQTKAESIDLIEENRNKFKENNNLILKQEQEMQDLESAKAQKEREAKKKNSQKLIEKIEKDVKKSFKNASKLRKQELLEEKRQKKLAEKLSKQNKSVEEKRRNKLAAKYVEDVFKEIEMRKKFVSKQEEKRQKELERQALLEKKKKELLEKQALLESNNEKKLDELKQLKKNKSIDKAVKDTIKDVKLATKITHNMAKDAVNEINKDAKLTTKNQKVEDVDDVLNLLTNSEIFIDENADKDEIKYSNESNKNEYESNDQYSNEEEYFNEQNEDESNDQYSNEEEYFDEQNEDKNNDEDDS